MDNWNAVVVERVKCVKCMCIPLWDFVLSMADNLNLACSVKLSEILNLDGFMQDWKWLLVQKHVATLLLCFFVCACVHGSSPGHYQRWAWECSLKQFPSNFQWLQLARICLVLIVKNLWMGLSGVEETSFCWEK